MVDIGLPYVWKLPYCTSDHSATACSFARSGMCTGSKSMEAAAAVLLQERFQTRLLESEHEGLGLKV